MFLVDAKGLRKVLQRRGIEHALYEPIQNALDEQTTAINVQLSKEPGSRFALLRVEDDNPTGFADLTHAYTLFAESAKKSNPLQRGRFNIGEKLVIAACEESRVITTTGGVEFVDGERRRLRRKTDRGSIFEGRIKMTNEQYETCCKAMHRILMPRGVVLQFNGELIPSREPAAVVEGITLRTEIADDEGNLRPASRKTEIRVYKPLPDEDGMIYELGIPVAPTGDDFHCDVQQKVPLSMDREHVPQAYLRDVRTAVLNVMHAHLDAEAANHTWVQDALQDPTITDEAVRTVIAQRFGKAVVFDPQDREANHRAASEGYTVVYGGSLSRQAWENVRRAGALLPAGKVTPTPKPYGDGPPYEIVDPNSNERCVIDGIQRLARVLLGHAVTIHLISTPGVHARATYKKDCPLVLNRRFLGHDFFQHGMSAEVLSLMIHEFGHEYESDHFSANYYRALTRLGGKLAHAVKDDPTLLDVAAA